MINNHNIPKWIRTEWVGYSHLFWCTAFKDAHFDSVSPICHISATYFPKTTFNISREKIRKESFKEAILIFYHPLYLARVRFNILRTNTFENKRVTLWFVKTKFIWDGNIKAVINEFKMVKMSEFVKIDFIFMTMWKL